MSQLVANCPRCTTQKTSFNLLSTTPIGRSTFGAPLHEAFCVCTHCLRSTTFVIGLKANIDARSISKYEIVELPWSVNNYFDIVDYISLKNAATTATPEHLPQDINDIFNEGATCLAVGCFNAAGTMFRLCVDIASKSLLPQAPEPSQKIPKMLGPRLNWLFEKNLLQKNLHELSSCIKEDGNEGAHQGTLTKIEAEDLLDFTTALLEQLYTEPAKIQINIRRREERRAT